MKILIGYSMRSGSTLLQHVLNNHSMIRSYSDLSSFWAVIRSLARFRPKENICVKPMDLLYLQSNIDFYRHFDRFIWLTRDPRDSYLSTIESGYAYLFWLPGRKREGIDIGLIKRWRQVYRHYFKHPEKWYLVKYEDLVTQPDLTLRGLLDYLDLPFERLHPFQPFDLINGGDFKAAQHTDLNSESARRYQRQFTARQNAVFTELLAEEMLRLGYLSSDQASTPRTEAKLAAAPTCLTPYGS